MDLNTALMESITSMSEYFVAANTRTSFTDLAESSSNSYGPLNPSTNNNNNNDNISNNINSAPNANGPNPANLNNPEQLFGNNSMMNLHKQLSPTSVDHLNDLSQVPNNNHQRSFDGAVDNSLDSSPLQHTSSNFRSHIIQNRNKPSPYHDNHRPLSKLHTQRIPQPTRSQIPIHCYIEQLDANADIPSYQPTLTDNDLFKTANPNDPIKASSSHQDLNILNSGGNVNQSMHLHQSKLALESVTNCNTPSTELPHLKSSGLFDETDAGDDIDCVDANLDHLGSDSPLSLHQTNATDSLGSGNNGYQRNTDVCQNTSNQRPTTACYNTDNQNIQSIKETYVIINTSILFIDLVRTVMQQLGYSPIEQINAKASLQVKSWKPIGLEQISDDKLATIGEVLGDLFSFVTLRIKIYSSVNQGPTEWTETMIRQIVVTLTQNMSQLTLSKLCNISQPLISSIVRGGKKLGRRKCQEFGQWYLNYIQSTDVRPAITSGEGVGTGVSLGNCSLGGGGSSGGARLVFDKTREIPRLKEWFANNSKPSEELLEEYSRLLNEDISRKDKPQVSAKALKNWWKNERQKLGIRQREIRGRPKLKQLD